MIRGHGYLKYLKLFSIGFGISFFMGLGVNSVSAWEYVPCKYTEMVGDYATSGNCIKASPGETVDISNYKFVLNGGNITIYDYSTNNTYSGLYGKNRYNGLNITRNIYKNGKYVTLYKAGWGLNEPRYSMLSGSIACISNDYNTCLWNSDSFRAIYYERDLSIYNGQTYDYVILPYTQQSTNAQAYGYCFHFPSENGYLCFPIFQNTSLNGYTYTGITSNTFENTVSDSFPFGGGNYNNNGGIELDSVEGAINYYEKTYGWDKSICYAGIDSLSYIYGQNGVAFQEGQGLTIFDVYTGIYGSLDINKTYVWLNSLIGNYELRYGVSGSPSNSSVGNPPYLMSYNSGTNQVDLYYDDLTFPFSGKPVALYFLASNLESKSIYSTMGSSIVSYCNLKINNGTFDDIIDNSDKNNINNYSEQSNVNQGLNPDGTDKQYTGAWLSSGVELAFSGNTSIKNTLQNFFDRFNSAMGSISSGSGVGILPAWLIGAFLFVVLFKFLRKR